MFLVLIPPSLSCFATKLYSSTFKYVTILSHRGSFYKPNRLMSQRSGMNSEDPKKQSLEQKPDKKPQKVFGPSPEQAASESRQRDDPSSTPTAQTPVNTSPSSSKPTSRKTSGQSSRKGGPSSGKSSGVDVKPKHQYFKSRRIKNGTLERPWLDKPDPREKWQTIIPLIGLFVGLVIAGFLIWDGIRSVGHYKYCPVLDEDFTSGFNEQLWTKEVEVGGFG